MTHRAILMEALWETIQDYGVRWTVADQVSVARDLEAGLVRAGTVTDVIQARGLTVPRGFSVAFVKRYRALVWE